MKTASLWGAPPTRFYTFLQRLEQRTTGTPTLAVLGCADGKFVLPAARRGIKVWAIDIDEVTLFGGYKDNDGEQTRVPGLVSRLKTEGLEDLVEVRHGSFVDIHPERRFDGVFTSGALQYSNNTGNDLGDMVTRLGGLVREGGLLYIDYMLPHEEKYKGRPNCPEAGWWKDYFRARSEWNVVYNRAMRPTLDKAHLDYPVDHYHQWGHLLAERHTS
ncbi:hypothetical protein QR77_38025 [Streptomyces sp. 150FB]|uniref:class I SAM-dependent methyltransferase n=1 Tax=Streptomyces sp. 150FB TaxID=1576605 RepID=UPI00058938FB|nr:class I SAM-dependent methyltransferase [Streptomyces sp. 150FB]KIF78049.1 hypothetical protein QR77_38025 [Streptomyces sp. 150FB]